MNVFHDSFYKKSLKTLCILIAALTAARFTHGYVLPPIAFLGCFWALSGRLGRAVSTYMFFPLLIVVSPMLLPKEGSVWGLSIRFGSMAIAFCMCIGAARLHGRHRLPFGGLIPFLLSACIGSATGWWPMVSYMKLLNYFVFMLGIWLGTQNLQNRPCDVQIIRASFFAMSVFLVIGSIVVWPFPQISYATGLQWILQDQGVEAALAAHRDMIIEGSKTLFCGITNHSQSLAPILSLSFAWVLCDMLFIEKRVRWLHALLIMLSLPMLFMTRSRVAFTTLVASLVMINFYTVRKIMIPVQVRRHLARMMLAFVVLVVMGAAVLEVKDNTVSKWLRKTQDVQADTRTLKEAMTESRMSLMEMSLYEFKRNPLFGSGFQVAEYSRDSQRGRHGIVLSASIEKGVLPVMVLGETGIVGEILFVLFLISFYMMATRRRLYVTITMFSLLLVSNLGEASFFSPGGIGSILYILTVVGGFVTDTILLYERKAHSVGAVPMSCHENGYREYRPSMHYREVHWT